MTLPCFSLDSLSEDERVWHATTAIAETALSEPESALLALLLGEDVSMMRLAWAYFHAPQDSTVKELLRQRIRRALGASRG